MHGPADEGSVKALRRNPNDCVQYIIEPLRLPNDLRIAFEATPPKLITDYHHGMSVASCIFTGLEAAPQNGMDADRVEIVCGDDAPGRDIGAIPDTQGTARNL